MVIVEVCIASSSTIRVGDGGGEIWVISIGSVVENLNFFGVTSI